MQLFCVVCVVCSFCYSGSILFPRRILSFRKISLMCTKSWVMMTTANVLSLISADIEMMISKYHLNHFYQFNLSLFFFIVDDTRVFWAVYFSLDTTSVVFDLTSSTHHPWHWHWDISSVQRDDFSGTFMIVIVFYPSISWFSSDCLSDWGEVSSCGFSPKETTFQCSIALQVWAQGWIGRDILVIVCMLCRQITCPNPIIPWSFSYCIGSNSWYRSRSFTAIFSFLCKSKSIIK